LVTFVSLFLGLGLGNQTVAVQVAEPVARVEILLDDKPSAVLVAVAGVTAASGNRRRGVLLVLGPESEDSSDATPATARRYLAALGVPLFVWSPDPATARNSPWGEARLVSTPGPMSRATNRIFRELERQRIVWVEGKHLP
jgi:hypothetical protein